MTLLRFKSEVNEFDGVYQIKIDVPFGVRFVSLYLFKIGEKNVLIDAGLNNKSWMKIFFERLAELNMTISDIDTCIITHSHIDHIGLIGVLREKILKQKYLCMILLKTF